MAYSIDTAETYENARRTLQIKVIGIFQIPGNKTIVLYENTRTGRRATCNRTVFAKRYPHHIAR